MTYLNAKKFIWGSPDTDNQITDGINSVLEALGAPHRRLKFIRLAGSNGKTVCAQMLSSVVANAGYKVGLLRMPMREELRENICINSNPLSMDELANLTTDVRIVCLSQSVTLTRSELMLCIAVLAFHRTGCELCLLESDPHGIQAASVLPPPFAALICGIIPTEDKSELAMIRSFICNGVQEIVASPQNAEAFRIITDTCYAVSCRLRQPTKSAIEVKRLNLRGSLFTYKDTEYSIGVCGRFQISNAVLVIEAVDIICRNGYRISRENVQNGLESFKIPAHFEIVSINPLIVVDSNHANVAIDTVCASLAEFQNLTSNRLILCLPNNQLIDSYSHKLTAHGYSVDSVLTVDAQNVAYSNVTQAFKTPKAMIKEALSLVEPTSTLLISGDNSFVTHTRYELLSTMGF